MFDLPQLLIYSNMNEFENFIPLSRRSNAFDCFCVCVFHERGGRVVKKKKHKQTVVPFDCW